MGGFILNNVMLATFLIKHPYSSWEDKTSIMVRFFSLLKMNFRYVVVLIKIVFASIDWFLFDAIVFNKQFSGAFLGEEKVDGLVEEHILKYQISDMYEKVKPVEIDQYSPNITFDTTVLMIDFAKYEILKILKSYKKFIY